MEIFWNDWRDQVTHNHDRLKIKDLEKDSDCYFARCARHPDDVLRRIGSPFAKHSQNRKDQLVSFSKGSQISESFTNI